MSPDNSNPQLVTAHRDLGDDWFELEVEAPEIASQVRAGQFVQVAVGAEDAPLTRRPFSVFDVRPHDGVPRNIALLCQVVGVGTRWLNELRAGDRVDLLGPLGNPLPHPDLPTDGVMFLVGGGIGVAPLFLYTRELLARVAAPRFEVVLGARRSSLLKGGDAFAALGVAVHAATDDGSAGFHGNVVELLQRRIAEHDGVEIAGIGCGPHGMNVALRDFAVRREIPFWISLENVMPCGFGACFGCVIESPAGSERRYRRVCVEGPAFLASELPAHF
ncbi:MAG: dihydroorotate dehydrogenase electron transfer subunit [Planctomycetes bacterium]|nr:dihydroorotate dehydrogenase electron transfer subunit [Planctomycetota bacterium]